MDQYSHHGIGHGIFLLGIVIHLLPVLLDVEAEPKDKDYVCLVVQEVLSNRTYLSNYTIVVK